jgi:tRNA threonylcarbamoyladenosine modification (KEOPS) complex  Pcc1 subunit
VEVKCYLNQGQPLQKLRQGKSKMHYTCVITVKSKEVNKIFKALGPELKQQTRNRSEIFLQKLKDCLNIKINANDSVALRATFNNITKLLTVYDHI